MRFATTVMLVLTAVGPTGVAAQAINERLTVATPSRHADRDLQPHPLHWGR
jgi:hypothetical protein